MAAAHCRCHWHAGKTVHINSPGNITTSVVLGSKVMHHWDGLFSIPPLQLTPKDTTFDPEQGEGVPAWWTSSGHLVVEPLIDGKKMGNMILDTGANLSVLSAIGF